MGWGLKRRIGRQGRIMLIPGAGPAIPLRLCGMALCGRAFVISHDAMKTHLWGALM
jgi:hypothetical protein